MTLRMALPGVPLAVGATLLAVLALAPRAGAVILPANTIDGPSEQIVGFGGVSMAEDGTGGVVYLKRENGVAHVFVSRFVGGSWLAPVRVDTQEPFAASSPRIAAGPNGQLVVVWATAFATLHERPVDELLGATLGQGSSTFGQAILIDPNIKDGTGLSPDLTMSTNGTAVVVYRVVRETQERELLGIPLFRPEDVIEDVRMARYQGERWTKLGVINRNPGVSMRPPSEANAPRVAIGPTGNGVVVWQEPDINGVARIWARRFFGSTLDYVLPVSASSLNGKPVGLDADAPGVAISRLGQAEVAYRQAGGPGSPLPSARILLNILPDGESADGSQFQGAAVVDSAAAARAGGSIGEPCISLEEKDEVRLLYDAGGEPRVVVGEQLGLVGALSLGSPFAGAETSCAIATNPSGGAVAAWPSADGAGHPGVSVREDFPSGAVQTGLVFGGAGGEVAELAAAGSGFGDALVAFRQGPFGNASVVVARATAAPQPFVLSAPKHWIRPNEASVTWAEAPSADPPLTYTVVLDGRRVPTPAGTLSARLAPRGLGAGVHRLQVLATDSVGQSTLTAAAALKVDARPPTVTIRSRSGNRASVSITDLGPGVKTGSVTISFGDGGGSSRRLRASHAYSHPGVYTITVHATDRLGLAANVRRQVSVR